jgi:hypothetical protein
VTNASFWSPVSTTQHGSAVLVFSGWLTGVSATFGMPKFGSTWVSGGFIR